MIEYLFRIMEENMFAGKANLVKVAFYLYLLVCSSGEAQVVRRAAFDFGSGKIKLQVADVDTARREIVNPIYADAKIVLLSEDLATNQEGQLSEEIQAKALKAAKKLKKKALALGAIEFAGLATEAYRKAPNGQVLIDKYLTQLGIPVKMIPQTEEGRLGFLALVAENKLDPTQVVVWDIGGGSLQVTYLDDDSNLQVYMAPFGRITTKNAIIQFIKRDDLAKVASPNPMNKQQWQQALNYFQAVLPQPPESLLRKLKNSKVQLIGIAAHPEKLRILGNYNESDIQTLLEERLNKTDEELSKTLESPSTAISELVLVQSILKKLQAHSVHYIRTSSGSSSALLTDEAFWPTSKH